MIRNINDNFWNDSKIVDEFTPEDRYFYLYLLTTPCLKLCGCFEISNKRISVDTGYDIETVKKLIDRFANIHKVITYDQNTKEILINHYDMNWNSGEKVSLALSKQIVEVKSPLLRNQLVDKFNKRENVELLEMATIPDGYDIGNIYPMDSLSIGFTNTIPNTKSISKPKNKKEKQSYKDISFFDDPELDEAFHLFIEHRDQIKKPMTEMSIKMNVTRLNNMAKTDKDRIEIINNSIANGWQGLFPLEKKKPKNEIDWSAL